MAVIFFALPVLVYGANKEHSCHLHMSKESQHSSEDETFRVSAEKVTVRGDNIHLVGARVKGGGYRAIGQDMFYHSTRRIVFLRGDLKLTFCQENPPIFSWEAEKAVIYLDKGKLRSYDMWLRVGGLKLIYLPVVEVQYGSLVKRRRESGLLVPDFDYSSNYGVALGFPVYFNMAPNRDILFTPRYYTHRGAGFGLNFRYLEPLDQGSFDVGVVPDDRITGDARYFLKFAYSSYVGEKFGLDVDIKHVSDRDVQRDFPNNFSLFSKTYLQSKINASFEAKGWIFRALGDSLQTATSTSRTGLPVIFKRRALLEVSREYFDIDTGLGFKVASQYDYFDDNTNALTQPDDVQRFHMSFYGEWETQGRGGLRITPGVGLDFTHYDAQIGDKDGSKSRFIPHFRLLMQKNWWIRAPKSTYQRFVDVKFLYLNVARENQDSLPLLDTSEEELNFHSIFDTNRFNGVDRIGDTNRAVFGVQKRWVHRETGALAFKLSLAQGFLFEDETVEIDRPRKDNGFSDSVFEASLHPNDWTQLGISLNFNPQEGKLVKQSYHLSLSGKNGNRLGLFYRYQSDSFFRPRENRDFEQLGFGVDLPISENWRFYTHLLYSLRGGYNLTDFVGLEYFKDCWKISLGRRKRLDSIDTSTGSLSSEPRNFTTEYTFNLDIFPGNNALTSTKMRRNHASTLAW